MKVSNYILIIIIIVLGVTLFIQNRVIYGDQKYQFIQGGDIAKAQMIDSLQRRCDSLQDELYPAEIQLNRYQIAHQILMERNPQAAEQYGNIISDETE
jgi:plasmid stabilization system protein ParE